MSARYVLSRPSGSDDGRLAEIHTPEEIVHPVLTDGVWRVECRTTVCSTTLQRRFRFNLDATEQDPDDDPPWRPPPPPVREETLPLSQRLLADLESRGVSRARPQLSHPDWLTSKRALDEASAEVLGHVADANTPVMQAPRVGVVYVVTGWDEKELAGLECCLQAVSQIAPGSRVVVVQNDTAAKSKTVRSLARHKHRSTPPLSVYTENHGFAAACAAGAAQAGDVEWLLFTQADASWQADDLRRAVAISIMATRWPGYGGRPPLVGPSGGYLPDRAHGAVVERGRNVGLQSGPGPYEVDFIAGYWLLIDRDVYTESGGWDAGYFLYYEDPDICLAARQACGALSVIWPAGITVNHGRGATISARYNPSDIGLFQAASRKRFIEKWGSE